MGGRSFENPDHLLVESPGKPIFQNALQLDLFIFHQGNKRQRQNLRNGRSSAYVTNWLPGLYHRKNFVIFPLELKDLEQEKPSLCFLDTS